MPLTKLSEEFAEAGFLIERIVEPQAVPELEEIDADRYHQLTTEPRFICFRLAMT